MAPNHKGCDVLGIIEFRRTINLLICSILYWRLHCIMDYWRDLKEFTFYLLNNTRWQLVRSFSCIQFVDYSEVGFICQKTRFHIQRGEDSKETGLSLVLCPNPAKGVTVYPQKTGSFEATDQRWARVIQGSATRALWQRSHKGGTQPSLWVSSYWKGSSEL